MEFVEKYNRLPYLYDLKDFNEVKEKTSELYDNIVNHKINIDKKKIQFDENIVKNVCFTASAQISCMTSFIGGMVCQEIIKATGKFRPIEQWEIFNFLHYSNFVPEKEKINLVISQTRYDELISIFGKEIVKKLQQLNILQAGAGALGCEIIKNLALFGIKGLVTVVDDDNIELSNLNRQFLFQLIHIGKNKADVAC